MLLYEFNLASCITRIKSCTTKWFCCARCTKNVHYNRFNKNVCRRIKVILPQCMWHNVTTQLVSGFNFGGQVGKDEHQIFCWSLKLIWSKKFKPEYLASVPNISVHSLLDACKRTSVSKLASFGVTETLKKSPVFVGFFVWPFKILNKTLKKRCKWYTCWKISHEIIVSTSV